ncbi:MMPL family transporter [Shouchella miscanthi]|uniref:MMPL family transporter n=1 Tax=Shouchella miscanthi TaxID=2598861 RepID=A0ABU6NRL5_9BACI|nr:MMPL family transporter [Shouchella miscanthi]
MNMFRTNRWTALIVWVLISVLAFFSLPDLGQLVRDKGEITLPDHVQSIVASNLESEMNGNQGSTYDLILVFDEESEVALSDDQVAEIESIIQSLKNEKEDLGITSIVNPFENPEVKEQLVSEDESAALVQMSVRQSFGTIDEVREVIKPFVDTDKVDVYVTGSDLIAEDFTKTTEDGIKKTEIVAVVFIILVLIVVFRSPIVPVVSLITVGVSYLVSMAIIAGLVQHVDFPFSNFTQVFLIVILFGVGTDYNILLYTNFKEELSREENGAVAIKNTIRSSGKTVLYSGIAVLIGFATLGLADFSFYQSTSAVAIGVAILILVLITLNPFFMHLLGKRMFWPSKRFVGHGDSRLWAFLASHSVLRPVVSLLLVAVFIVPVLMLSKGDVHYNDLLEVDNGYSSKQGIQLIQDKFPSGFSSPASLVIQLDEPLDTQSMLTEMDQLTDAVGKVDGVAEVMSPTRPTGEKIQELYIDDQTNTVGTGVDEANGGAKEIRSGLSEAEQQLSESNDSDFDHIQLLIDGTAEAYQGSIALQDAVSQIASGVSEGANGAAEIESGLTSLSTNLTTVSAATTELYSVYSQIEAGLRTFSETFTSAVALFEQGIHNMTAVQTALEVFLSENPAIASDPAVVEALQNVSGEAEQMNQLSAQLTEATQELEQALTAFSEANQSLNQVNQSMIEMNAGANQLAEGSRQLQGALRDGAEGAQTVESEAGKLGAGLTQIQTGQEQLQAGLQDLQGQMNVLQEGLLASTEGLDELSAGLENAEQYLGEVSHSTSAQRFFIPEDILESDEFQEGLSMYLSDDKQIARFTIILDADPFSAEAMDVVREIQEAVEASVKGTALEDANIAVGGQSAVNADLRDVANGDFLFTATIMLGAIALFLMVITRSIHLPLFIVGILAVAYYTSLSITEMVSGSLFGVEELSWNVPFFGFILLVAIGVDYSIFLLMKYRETEGDALSAIKLASRHIGGVIISAAIILGGTFAALYPSGVLTLMQVATLVIVGLFLLSILFLPVVLPALMSVTNKLGRWAKPNKQEE